VRQTRWGRFVPQKFLAWMWVRSSGFPLAWRCQPSPEMLLASI
jgi:hypothetical protein